MAVVEHNPHRIMPDRFQACDLDMTLTWNRLALSGAMSLYFGARTFHAQIFGCKLVMLAIVERHRKRVLCRAQTKLGRPGSRLVQPRSLSVSERASSDSITGMPS